MNIILIPLHIINLIFIIISGYGYWLGNYHIPNLGCTWCVPWYFEPLSEFGQIFPAFILIGVHLVIFHIFCLVSSIVMERNK